MKLIENLKGLVYKYDLFLIDIIGTLLEGDTVFAPALECLKSLLNSGKIVILFSNSPLTKNALTLQLHQLGIKQSLHFHALMNAGEIARSNLRHTTTVDDQIYCVGKSICPEFFDVITGGMTDEIQHATKLVVLGPEYREDSVEMYVPLLNSALRSNLPLYCANPDHYVKINEQRYLRAGLIASYYEARGGKVLWFGKPYLKIYESAINEAQRLTGENNMRVLAIGDNPHTDILGANLYGIDSLLVTMPEPLSNQTLCPTYYQEFLTF